MKAARLSALLALGLGALSCGDDPQTAAQVRADFSTFEATIDEFGDVRADLEILLDSGEPAVATVQLDSFEDQATVDVVSPVPMSCNGLSCDVAFTLPPGSYRFTLQLYVADRCGRESLVGTFRPEEEGATGLVSWGFTQLNLTRARFDFDDDGDGIINALEVQTCGRTDVDERDQAPGGCLDPQNPCCLAPADALANQRQQAWGSELIGRSAAFAGGTWPAADGTSKVVDAFHLDATEVTWGQLARCVAAGVCLTAPDHPARIALVGAPRHLPATGLTPNEAAQFCAWAGKRLPTDDEWDFAAAARDGDETFRAPYPFDARPAPGSAAVVSGGVVLPEDVGDLELSCVEGQGTLALNHSSSVPGVACELEPVSVGSYPSSHVLRGVGAPLADLAGNVWEWTLPAELRVDLDAPTADVFPGALQEAFIRGGNYRSAALSLSNTFNRIPVDSDDVLRLTLDDLGQATDAVGFRCAWDDSDRGALAEPRCPAP